MKILLGDFNAKLGREDIFKPTVVNEILHEISSDNGVTVVYFATLKYIIALGLLLMGKRNKRFHVLMYKRRYSNVVDIHYLRGSDCDFDHYLVVATLKTVSQ
jgi:hypothetical protein